MNACTRVCLRTCTCFYGPDVESLDATRERHSVTFTTVTTRLFTSSAEVPWRRDASCLFQLIPQRTVPVAPLPLFILFKFQIHIYGFQEDLTGHFVLNCFSHYFFFSLQFGWFLFAFLSFTSTVFCVSNLLLNFSTIISTSTFFPPILDVHLIIYELISLGKMLHFWSILWFFPSIWKSTLIKLKSCLLICVSTFIECFFFPTVFFSFFLLAASSLHI